MRNGVTTAAAAIAALAMLTPTAANAVRPVEVKTQLSVYEIAAKGDTPTTNAEPRALPAAVALATAGIRGFTAASAPRAVTHMAKNASITSALWGFFARTASTVDVDTEIANVYFDR